MPAPPLGAHMSIAGGPANALRRGHSIACDAIQMFTRNANRWASRELRDDEIADFVAARRETGIEHVVAHSSYLINIGSPNEALWEKSLAALITELGRCAQLGIRDYVLHPGAHMDAGEEAGLERIAEGLARALEATADAETQTIILLENTAGQGSVLGYRFEHLAWLIAHTEPAERLGVCFDTAHALAAGYEYRQPETYAAFWRTFDELVGLPRLRAIHLNDALRDLGSHIDRHEHIGKGHVGLDAFRLLLNDPALAQVPMLLETPKGQDMAEDVENLAVLRSLIA